MGEAEKRVFILNKKFEYVKWYASTCRAQYKISASSMWCKTTATIKQLRQQPWALKALCV